MCIINEIKNFVSQGADTLRKSSKGLYNIESDEVKEIRREIFEETSTRADDAVKLRKDMEHIRSDVRVSFNKLILGNG